MYRGGNENMWAQAFRDVHAKDQTSIWKCLIYLALLVVALFLASCSKDDVLRLKEFGTVGLEASKFNTLTGKTDYVLCSDEEPVKIQYVFVDENGANWIEESAITTSGNDITPIDEVRLPIGVYTVEDIALVSESGVVTHRVPNRLTTSFDFSSFVDVSTPFGIEILPEQETAVSAEVLCYTSEILDLSGTFGGATKILDLQTLYFELPEGGCVNRVLITSDGKEIVDVTVSGRGIRGAPIIKGFEVTEVIAFDGQTELGRVSITEYNVDNKMNYFDVIKFNFNCN